MGAAPVASEGPALMTAWSTEAAKVIMRVIAAGRAAGDDTAAIRKRVDAAYPFGQRSYWPYKAWLAQRQRLFFGAGLSTPAERARLEAARQKRMADGRQSTEAERARVLEAERLAREAGLIR